MLVEQHLLPRRARTGLRLLEDSSSFPAQAENVLQAAAGASSSAFLREKRQRGRGGTGGGAGGGVEREQGEESEFPEEAKVANGEKEQEVERQWRRGGGAFKFGFQVQG